MIKAIDISKVFTPQKNSNSRNAIRTHEPLQEWIVRQSALAGLSYPILTNKNKHADFFFVKTDTK